MVYGIDYQQRIQVQGGSTVRLVAADPDCQQTKNCDGTEVSATCGAPIRPQNIEVTAITRNPSFNFQNDYNGQWLVMTVKSVTSP
jgi:hypothetical protein